MTPAEVEQWIESRGLERFRADQVLHWLYPRCADDFSKMNNLPGSLRGELAAVFSLSMPREVKRLVSEDGAVKFVFQLGDGELIESVWMPKGKRSTACVSSQAGCRMGCRFCRTGRAGLRRQLSPAEIIGQVMVMAAGAGKIGNVVFMGMGEPLDNRDAVLRALEILCSKKALGFASRAITVSTIGLPRGIKALAEQSPGVNLAVSLHSVVPATRAAIMAAAGDLDLSALKQALKHYPLSKSRKVTLEVVLIKGVNDSTAEARALARWVSGLAVKVNLIPCNPWPGSRFEASAWPAVRAYQEVLHNKGLGAFVRKSRGRDVSAACGQLRSVVEAGIT